MISANNGFLVAIGVIGGGKSKAVTPIGKQLGDALSHQSEDESRRLWADIVEQTEFLKNVLGAIRIRRGMEEGALKAHIAYSAGVSKSASVTTGAGTVIEVLRRAGDIEEVDGKFVVSSMLSVPTPVSQPLASDSFGQSATTASVATKVAPDGSPAQISLSIEITVTATVAELDGLGERLRKVVEEFSRQHPDE
jgi:hypothetical protein